jgi:tyrosyl-tRNA synthetase
MPIHLPTKAIRTAVEASLASLGVNGLSPCDIPDHHIRRASKAAKRVIEQLEELTKAIEKFEQNFATAEAKTPKKKLLADIEKAIQSDPENLEKVARALDDVIRGDMSEQIHESRPEKSASKTALDQRDAAGRIPDTAGTTDARRDGGRAAAAGAARPPRRRHKMIDPLVAAMRQSND